MTTTAPTTDRRERTDASVPIWKIRAALPGVIREILRDEKSRTNCARSAQQKGEA